MSNPVGAQRYGLGGGDAYYDAVKYGGYTGTREQFGRDQAEFAQNATAVAEAREEVEQNTQTVVNTAQTFTEETVPAAIQSVEEKGDTEEDRLELRTTELVEAVNTAGAVQVQAVRDEGTTQIGLVSGAGTAQVEVVEQVGTNQVQAVNDAGITQVGNVNQAGEDQVNAVEQAGADQVQAVQNKGTEVINSIPSDYIELTEDVDNLKTAFENLPYAKYIASRNTDGKWLNASGTINTQDGWSITDYLPIGESATFYLKTRVSSDNVKSCFYDEDKTFISAFKTETAGYNVLQPVDRAKYVRFSIQTADASDFSYVSQLFLKKCSGEVTPDVVFETTQDGDISKSLIIGSYYNADGTLGTSASWARSKLYSINEGDELTVTGVYNLYAIFYDSSKNVVSSRTITGGLTAETITITSGISFVAFNVLVANIGSTFSCSINGIPVGARYKINWLRGSPWNGCKYISHGDSLTWQDGKAYQQGDVGAIARGYQTILSENVDLAYYSNYGKSSWSMAVVNDNGVVNTITEISNYDNYQLCTISCGTNDFKLNVPLGTLGQIGDTTFDTTTFYGAYRKSVEHILTNSLTTRIVLMTPLQRNNDGYDVNYTNSAGHKLIDYVNAIKNIGEMYGLPVCDMYSNSGITSLTFGTYLIDGLHPNDVGYKRMGDYLTGFLNAIGN